MRTKTSIFVTLFLLLMPFGWEGMSGLRAQSIAMDVIGSAGTYVSAPGGSMAWTIGEVTIETYSSTNNFFTQGFHQPDKKTIVTEWDFFIPEGFSPNGDYINDLFVIRGIDHYPNNTFVIFNRWGNKIYETIRYQNTWDGRTKMGLRVGGDELPVSTYFYILDLGNGTRVFKGTIYLNR